MSDCVLLHAQLHSAARLGGTVRSLPLKPRVCSKCITRDRRSAARRPPDGVAPSRSRVRGTIFRCMTKGMKVLTIDRSIDRSIDVFTGFHKFYATVIGRQVEPKKQLSCRPITAGRDRSIDRSIVNTLIPNVISNRGRSAVSLLLNTSFDCMLGLVVSAWSSECTVHS